MVCTGAPTKANLMLILILFFPFSFEMMVGVSTDALFFSFSFEMMVGVSKILCVCVQELLQKLHTLHEDWLKHKRFPCHAPVLVS